MADILDLLNQLFNLDKIIAWAPSAKVVASITTLVYVLKRLLGLPFFKGWFDKLTHGKGTLALVALVAVLTDLLPKLDGGLTWYELLASFVLSGGSAVAFWEFLKVLFPFLKRNGDGQA